MKTPTTYAALLATLCLVSAALAQQNSGLPQSQTDSHVTSGNNVLPSPERQARMDQSTLLGRTAAISLHAGRYAEAEAEASQALSLERDSGVAAEILAASLDAQGKQVEITSAPAENRSPQDGQKVENAKAAGLPNSQVVDLDAGGAKKLVPGQPVPHDPEDKRPYAHEATPTGAPGIGEDPRGESPRKPRLANPALLAGAVAEHPNQPVTPSRYAMELTTWLALPEKDRASTPPPEPPEGTKPSPLAVQPVPGDAKTSVLVAPLS